MHFFLYNIILNFGAHVIHRITIFSSVACNWLPALSCCCISNFLCALSTLLYFIVLHWWCHRCSCCCHWSWEWRGV